jgi:hypothetical protein
MSELKVNKVSPRSGTTVTIGDSGDTINLVGTVQNNGSPLPGDISSVTAGTGLSGGGSTGDVTLNLDLNELTTSTSDADGDFFAVVDAANAQKKLTKGNINISGFNNDSGFIDGSSLNADNLSSGTVPTARISGAYTGITQTGTLTSFASTGIDDNATSTSLTIASDGRTTLDATNEKALVVHHSDGSTVRIGMNNNSTNSNEIAFESTAFLVKPGGFEKFRIDSLGNVGIGTTSPTSNLHVESSTGTALLKATGTDTGATLVLNGNKTSNTAGIGSIQFQNNGDSVGMLRSFRESANDAGGLSFWTQATGGSNSEKMRITSTGEVGIGLTSPQTYGGFTIKQQSDTSSEGIAVVNNSLAQSVKLWVDGTNAYLSSGNTGADPLILNAGGGNVGIGTSSPEELLDLNNGQPQNIRAGLRTYLGAGYSTGGTVLGHSVKVDTTSPSGSAPMEVTETNSAGGAPAAIRMTNGRMEFHTASSGTLGATFDNERMRIDSSGNVGINTTNPQQLLHANGHIASNGFTILNNTSSPPSGVTIHKPANNTMAFRINSTEEMRLTSTGLGIGTSSPLYPLHVNGSALFSGTIIATGGSDGSDRRASITHDGTNMLIKASGNSTNRGFSFHRSGDGSADEVLAISTSGHVTPGFNDAQDLGSTSKVWRNIYTGDLHLSNEAKDEGNAVDGTKGNWTIQEGAEDLYILNNKTGKKFKFKLEEIS